MENIQHQSLRLSVAEGVFCIQPHDIIRLEASSNYTYIHCINQKKVLSARVLKAYEQLLNQCGFIRTHHRHLVNVQHISHIEPSGTIVMKDASRPLLSRRKKHEALRHIAAQGFSGIG